MTQVGPYRLEERLGHGGMGTVHRATDRFGRSVAVKVLHPHIAFDTSSRNRLEREVSTLARVRHPRVASFLDADVEGPTPYIVTEFVPGLPLDEHVALHGPLDGPELHRFVAGVHEALRAIHAVGVVHRDLKPGNVMVDRAGEPVIIDFGIAHIGEESRLTATGLVMGTPGYLAPELIEGGQPTVATDWWGLGAVLAFASMGRNPYGGGANEAILARIRRGEHDLRSMDPAWRPLAEACLGVHAGDRPTAAEVREVVARGGGDLPQRRDTQPLQVATGAHVPWEGDPDATQPVTHGAGAHALGAGAPTIEHRGAGAYGAYGAGTATQGAVDADATQVVGRDATRALPRSAVSRRDESVLQPPPQHRDQPAGQLREPSPAPRMPMGGPSPQSATPTPAQMSTPPQSAVPTSVPPQTATPAPGHPQGEAWPADPQYPGAQQRGIPREARLHPYDPRTRQPRHSWVVLLGWVAAIAAAMLWPVLAAAGVVLWILVARWADHTAMAHLNRLFARGRRPGDVWRIAVGTPWHLLTAALRGLVGVIAPALLGGATVVVANLAMGHGATDSFLPRTAGLDNALAWGAGALVTALCLWWGIDSGSLRRGTRLVLSSPLRSAAADLVVSLVLVAATAGVVLWGLSHQWPTSLWPVG